MWRLMDGQLFKWDEELNDWVRDEIPADWLPLNDGVIYETNFFNQPTGVTQGPRGVEKDE